MLQLPQALVFSRFPTNIALCNFVRETDFCLICAQKIIICSLANLFTSLSLTLFFIQRFSIDLLNILVRVDILFADILWSLWPLEKE